MEEKNTWKIFIVDNEYSVFDTTVISLQKASSEFTKLKNINLEYCYFDSAKNTIEALQKQDSEETDVAVIFLDVVMEDSGFEVIKYLKEVAKNNLTQIILRTGQAGKNGINKPVEIALEYDINDFISKDEQYQFRLGTSLINSLRMFEYLGKLNQRNNELKNLYLKFISDFSNREIIFSDSLRIPNLILDVFNQLKNIYSLPEKKITNDAIEKIASIENISFRGIFLLLENVILKSLYNVIDAKEVKFLGVLTSNKMIWQKSIASLEKLYEGLLDKKLIGYIKKEIFINHFRSLMIPDQLIDWTGNIEDLSHLYFELVQFNYLNKIFKKDRHVEVARHFYSSKLNVQVNPGVLKAYLSKYKSKDQDNEEFVLWTGDNSNRDNINEIMLNIDMV
ncbi:MAG: hypothetical protein WC223_10745 [Bacteroidales bacterium]|jgi:hypothetical protein